MAGNVAQLQAEISAALNVPHGTTSQRDAIAQGLAQAFSNYVESLQVTGSTSGGVCPFTTTSHITIDVTGSLE